MQVDELEAAPPSGDADGSAASAASVSMPKSRGYQQEMLEESLLRNIVIALDTGAGKTHIAVLRMKLEVERESTKVCWFLAPTVALANQQYRVIKSSLPVNVAMISGANEPDQWKDIKLWQRVLSDHRIVVTTHDVLLNALRHGYVKLGRDINLLVFDEAHHAADKHPYNLIMQEFYRPLPERPAGKERLSVPSTAVVRPMVIGLTASPIFGGDVEKAFMKIEYNLDSTIRAPLMHRAELAGFVHRPRFDYAIYTMPPYQLDSENAPTAGLRSLKAVIEALDINEDPYVESLRRKLRNSPAGPEKTRTDQRLSKSIAKRDTYTHKGLRDLHRAVDEICMDVGTWASDWLLFKVLEQARRSQGLLPELAGLANTKETRYLTDNLDRVETPLLSYDDDAILAGCSHKTSVLIDALLAEKESCEGLEEDYRALVFVTRRDAVLSLAELLAHHPRTRNTLRVGCLLGNSESTRRHSFLDITRHLLKQDANKTLNDFRTGDLDVIIATAVAEEGLDIQACNHVVRWDPPPNMVSWAQSRGRARKQRSTFTVMFSDELGATKIADWHILEERMNELYNQERAKKEELEDDGEELNPREFVHPETGAKLTLNSAVEHLTHFCAILPWSGRSAHAPIFEVLPHEYPPEWHNYGGYIAPPIGPFGCTVTLPRLIDASFRSFSTPEIHATKVSARRHVAFQAYLTLHEKGLLNEHLLPLMSQLEPEKEEEVRMLLKEVEKHHGTTRVTSQMDPWLPSGPQETWWSSLIQVPGLPDMRLLTLRPLATLSPDEMPILHSPERGSFRVHVHTDTAPYSVDADTIAEAREYTRRLFVPLFGSRMTWEKTDFAFLFLPTRTRDATSSHWDNRRAAYAAEHELASVTAQPLLARASWFTERFGLPDDIFVVSESRRYGKPFRFVRWRTDPLSAEERVELYERYHFSEHESMEIKYPLLEVKPLTSRMNFLAPVPPEARGDDAASQRSIVLLPDWATIGLISADEARFAMYAPSILRYLAMANTIISMRETILRPAFGDAMPDLKLLLEAGTAPVAQESYNYQRLELLGDTVLKFLTSVNLLAEHRYWHEGYLARRKDHSVSNTSLAKAAVAKKMYLWVVRDRFSPRRWKPTYTSLEEQLAEPPIEIDGTIKVKKRQDLSTKLLADVIESTIGAAYIRGGLDAGTTAVRVFELGVPMQPLSERVAQIRSRAQELESYPASLSAVEEIIGHKFEQRALLVEALTHASYQSDLATVSYERMEFLGDAVLDMIVTDYLYRAPQQYSPGQLHLRKMAVVNAHFLALLCLRSHTKSTSALPTWSGRAVKLQHEEKATYLWQCLLHSSVPVLDEQNITFARWQTPRGGARIEAELARSRVFPWAPLMALQAPKFLSDMVESLLGAVFIDTHGSLDAVRAVLVRLGLMQVLERIVRDDVETLDPVSQLSLWASKRQEKIEYRVQRRTAQCTVVWDGFEVLTHKEEWHGRASQEDARFAAAERALHLLRDPVTRLEILARKWEKPLNYDIHHENGGGLSCGVSLDFEVARVYGQIDAPDALRRKGAEEALKLLEDPRWRLETWCARREIEYEFVWDMVKDHDDDEESPVCVLFVGGVELARKRRPRKWKRFVHEDVEKKVAKLGMVILDEEDAEAANNDEGLVELEQDAEEGEETSAWDAWEAEAGTEESW
ncbi:unnamed protein product [Peniophora sp. CBMAI 1063]|nr:unnamed protein product [Peniophora sp. CBMAI 1063]